MTKTVVNPSFTPNFTHDNFNFTTFQNPNFTHFNHISRQSHHFPAPEIPQTHIYRQPHHPPAPETPFFRRATKSNGYSYITFRLSSFSKRELKDLKKRLVSDLHRVRVLRQRIHHDLTGLKRPSPSPSPLPLVKETTKKQKSKVRNNNVVKKSSKKGRKNDGLMKNCKQILGKLMQHKNGWVFNTPVDTIGMKLYDYNDIIKKPMDLGTIKGKIERNEYNGDRFEFANDVRLTFNNAMLYNGKGSNVYGMAERLLLLFEGLFSGNENVNGGKGKRNGEVAVKVEKAAVRKVVEKRKRREMTGAEKEELAKSLFNMNLGDDGINELVGILKGKASGLRRVEDEIEIDIGVIDEETLWELRGFIDGKKKKMGCFLQADNNCIVSEPKGVMEEEDVDIGEEIQLTNYTSVEIEKDSGSSSSDSDSSSSGSSSDCSSGSGYNEEEANSTPPIMEN